MNKKNDNKLKNEKEQPTFASATHGEEKRVQGFLQNG